MAGPFCGQFQRLARIDRPQKRLPSGRFAPSAPSPSAPALRPSAGAPLRGSPASRLPLPGKCLAASGQKLGSGARLRRAVPRTPPRTTRTAAAAARSQGAFEKSRGDRRRSIPNDSAAGKAARLNARKEGGRGACNLIRPARAHRKAGKPSKAVRQGLGGTPARKSRYGPHRAFSGRPPSRRVRAWRSRPPVGGKNNILLTAKPAPQVSKNPRQIRNIERPRYDESPVFRAFLRSGWPFVDRFGRQAW